MVLGDEISKWKTLRLKDPESIDWSEFQSEVFPYQRLNLNPSTFGSPSVYCQKGYDHFFRDNMEAYPLRLYEKGREEIAHVRSLAHDLWGSAHHYLNISQSSSQIQNLLILNLLLYFYQEKRAPPFTVLTTMHEHTGGIGFFVDKKEMNVEYLSHDEITDVKHFQNKVQKLKPDIFFSSHLAYDTGFEFPVDEWSALIKTLMPECITVIDYAQSLGLLPIKPSQEIDFAFASSHKWLMGPYGLGFLWVSRLIFSKLDTIQWNGETLDSEWIGSGFEMKGGHSFGSYAALSNSLFLYATISVKLILDRSYTLLCHVARTLNEIFTHFDISVQYSSRSGFLSPDQFLLAKRYTGYFSIHFEKIDPYPIYCYLNEHSVHVKCIKKKNINLLRIGIPYYESKARLNKIFELVESFFKNQRAKSKSL